MTAALVCLAVAASVLTGTAAAGAWPQEAGHGFALNQVGYAFQTGGGARALFDGYGEAGLGDGLTAVFAFDADLDRTSADYVWRAGGGLRFSFALDEVPDWLLAVEGSFRYQGREGVVPDPVFAGNGWGGGIRVDAGRAFDIFDCHAFIDLGATYMYRPMAPAERRVELTAGLDLSENWQVGAGFASTFAPGAFYEPGAYEKHEAQAWVRWRLDADYALSVSITQTIAADRAPQETALRLALWSFFAPEIE